MSLAVRTRFLHDKAAGMPAALPASYADIWTDYMKAGEAMMQHVIMTGSTGNFGSAQGQITADPISIVASYQTAIDQALAIAAGGNPSNGEVHGTWFASGILRT